MQVVVHVPASLRDFSAGQRKVAVDVEDQATLEQVFQRLHASCPGVVERALDEQGAVRRHVNVFVDSDRATLASPVKSGSEVWILPAVSGG
jgi:molybdopterin synthase sulfur carrier subunit